MKAKWNTRRRPGAAKSRPGVGSRLKRRGLSLMEVMLAIAILGGSLAAIGELIRIGSRSAVASRELTTAQLSCESLMSEIVAGLLPAEPVGQTPLDSQTETGWYYTVDVQPVDQDGLLAITVIVSQDQQQTRRPLSFQMTRWMIDPALGIDLPPEEEAMVDESAGGTTQ